MPLFHYLFKGAGEAYLWPYVKDTKGNTSTRTRLLSMFVVPSSTSLNLFRVFFYLFLNMEYYKGLKSG